MWLDLVFEMPSGLRAGSLVAAVIAGIALLALIVRAVLKMGHPQALAQRLDALAGTGGQILSGVDLAMTGSQVGAAHVTQGMAQIAVDRAVNLAKAVKPSDVLPRAQLRRAHVTLGCVLAIVGIVALVAPRLVGTQWVRFVDPYGDHPPYSNITINVEPGNTKVIYGSGVDIIASPEGGTVERVELILRGDGREDEKLPMFPQTDGKWRATVASVTSPGKYFVKTSGTRSKQFDLGVITVPKIENVTFKVTPPSYTNRPPYEGPLPQGGLAGLPGTKVEVRAKSNRPLSAGQMQFVSSDSAKPPAAAMNPVADPSNEVLGSFFIQQAGKVQISVTDVEKQNSTDVFTAPVTVLPDNRPFVRIVEPLANSFATPDVTLPIAVQAEDDWGVSRVELFKGLNDSRSRGSEVAAPAPPQTKVNTTTDLPLKDLGLKPGDVLKLFARGEDNDPAGAKGTESSIVTVQIISKEDFEKLMLAREGMEVLQSKYEQAMRRLEKLDAEMEKVEKELAKADPNSDLAQEMRDKLKKLGEQFEQEAREMAKAANQDLPFDIDKEMVKHLRDLANKVNDAGDQLDKLAKRPGLGGGGALDELKNLRQQLGMQKKDFEQEVTEPLEHLAKIYPLMEDQQRFIELYQQQRELEQRMVSVKTSVSADDPRAKARMRDLESDQREIRNELRQLLDDIDSHVSQLPEDEKLKELRDTASEFCKVVRNSAASDTMSQAEMALVEFDGMRGWTSAKQAEDILAGFIKKCESMGGQGQMCLKFQPSLAQGLGNTVDQLMQASGMQGMGGGKGGYSARRSSLANVGLYGNTPRKSAQAGSRGGKADRGVGTHSNDPRSDDPASDKLAQTGETRGSGEGQTLVPARYRTRSGEYFQRVADELGK
jgi:hypothetical protein